jgi:methylase of polypeptide subunit release factors
MRTESHLWLSFLDVLRGIPRLRWLRLALAGWHFQVDAVSLVHDHIWDGTSLVLRKGIRRYIGDGQRVLDLGTGHLGLLAVFCARTHNARVVAVDVNKEFVENARLVAAISEAPTIDFRQSNWFSNVDGMFDVIFSNCPYIPTDRGCTYHDGDEHPEIWDGGRDGLAHVRTILANVSRFLNPEGLLLLGIDTSYISRQTTLDLVKDSPNLELRRIVRSWISTSEVYVIGFKTHGNTDG